VSINEDAGQWLEPLTRSVAADVALDALGSGDISAGGSQWDGLSIVRTTAHLRAVSLTAAFIVLSECLSVEFSAVCSES
jgi:hypothetical protein